MTQIPSTTPGQPASDPTTCSSATVADLTALEASMGKMTFRLTLKVIDHIDDGAAHWLSVSPLAFVAFGACSADRTPASETTTTAATAPVSLTMAGGAPGFAERVDKKRLSIPVATIDDPELAVVGARFGSVFLVPDIGETLRLNGRIAAVDSRALQVEVDECYVHCAKSLIRSAFWQATAREPVTDDFSRFVPDAAFMALATFDGENGADVSPKGDPAGSMIRLDGQRLTFAERPGNRRADSLRNIIKQPWVAAIALVPGTDQVAVISGPATISNDEAQRAAWVVAGKTPILTTSIDVHQPRVRRSAALRRADLWPVKPPAQAPNPAKMLVQHIATHRDQSAEAAEIRAALAVPGTMEKGLAESYRNNLY